MIPIDAPYDPFSDLDLNALIETIEDVISGGPKSGKTLGYDLIQEVILYEDDNYPRDNYPRFVLSVVVWGHDKLMNGLARIEKELRDGLARIRKEQAVEREIAEKDLVEREIAEKDLTAKLVLKKEEFLRGLLPEYKDLMNVAKNWQSDSFPRLAGGKFEKVYKPEYLKSLGETARKMLRHEWLIELRGPGEGIRCVNKKKAYRRLLYLRSATKERIERIGSEGKTLKKENPRWTHKMIAEKLAQNEEIKRLYGDLSATTIVGYLKIYRGIGKQGRPRAVK